MVKAGKMEVRQNATGQNATATKCNTDKMQPISRLYLIKTGCTPQT